MKSQRPNAEIADQLPVPKEVKSEVKEETEERQDDRSSIK